ncbi:MAG: hypothetical protein HY606_04315 [Planctomycetes bacterium]|nr:hypothetical protein [Planctomycetota bacterium]
MELNKEIIKRLGRLKTGDLDDGMAQLGIRNRSSDQRFKRIVDGLSLVGTAVTGRWYTGPDDGRSYNDDVAILYGLGHSVPGAVLVQQCDIPEFVCFGSGSSRVLKAEGFVGTITHGWIRDTDELRELKWPCWACGIRPSGLLIDDAPSGQRFKVEVNKPVEVSGVKVNPGDIIVADADGFCCIPQDRIIEVIKEAEKVCKIENQIFAMLDKGMSFKQILEADNRLRTVGTRKPEEF